MLLGRLTKNIPRSLNQFLDDLGGYYSGYCISLAAIIAIVISLRVAREQNQLQERQLKQDLFERRYAVFLAGESVVPYDPSCANLHPHQTGPSDGNCGILGLQQTFNLESLRGKFDTDTYLSPYSDIVALMVFEHQTYMMNLLTRIGWQIRYALRARNVRDLTANGVDETTQELVDYMLFVDETPLANKIEGTSGFAEIRLAGLAITCASDEWTMPSGCGQPPRETLTRSSS
jgi:hypothetical protein